MLAQINRKSIGLFFHRRPTGRSYHRSTQKSERCHTASSHQHIHPFPTNFGQTACNSVKVQPISTLQLPNHARPAAELCRTAEIACTISELHALSPKLAGKRCTAVTGLPEDRVRGVPRYDTATLNLAAGDPGPSGSGQKQLPTTTSLQRAYVRHHRRTEQHGLCLTQGL